ncbi:MAG: hypothetical protein Q8L48_24650 [Archangium sp.]|nr:hypothetical protein [Archangium sp.]
MATTLEETWQRLGFEDPATVERLLVRGALAGALAGGLGALVGNLTRGHHAGPFAVTFAAALLLLVLPRQTFGMLLALAGAATLLPVFVPWTPESLPYFFTVPLGLALALEPLPPLRRLVALAGPSLGGAWCLQLVQWLSARHLGAAGALAWLAILGAGLFLSVGAVLAWVTFAADAVEPKLNGQPKVLQAWLRLRTALGRLPKSEPRAGLEALVRSGALRCVSARAARDELASTLDEAAEDEARDAVKALQQRLTETTDAELAAHLEQLLRVHRDTLEQFDGLHRKLERLDARAAAEAGWLETAAFSVELAPKGEPGLRQLTSRLESLTSHPER